MNTVVPAPSTAPAQPCSYIMIPEVCLQSVARPNEIIVDSGCTRHLECTLAFCVRKRVPSVPISVFTGSGQCSNVPFVLDIAYVCDDASGRPALFERSDVLYVPAFNVNLFSTRDDWNSHGTRCELDDRLRLTLKCGRHIPFEEHNKQYVLHRRHKVTQAANAQITTLPHSPFEPSTPFLIYLCSGERRDGDLGEQLRAKAPPMEVVMIDRRIGGVAHDLARTDPDSLVRLASSKHCVGVLASCPCSTWSALRFADGGPPIVRDIDHPEGIPMPGGQLPPKVADANSILTNCTVIARAAASHGAAIMFECPVSRAAGSEHALVGRERHVSMDSYPALAKLHADIHMVAITFDQCMTGSPFKKTTQLLCSPNIANVTALLFFGLKCTHGHDGHRTMMQRNADGSFTLSLIHI